MLAGPLLVLRQHAWFPHREDVYIVLAGLETGAQDALVRISLAVGAS